MNWSDLRKAMRRYLFPTYDESLADHERMQKLGEERLKALAGLNIGDTVYIEGKLKGVVAEVFADPYSYFPSLSIHVKAEGKEAAAFTGIEQYALNSWVMFPCTLNNITKEPAHD